MIKRALWLALMGCMTVAHAADRIESADPRLDSMYQLAQRELRLDGVTQIRDWAYNGNQPIPCDCLETGEKWNFVWTRDLAYAADLGLARRVPVKVRNSLLFKASAVRNGPQHGRYVIAQDTGSGGSWPISTDRVVWFLAARHVLGTDRDFDARYRLALIHTLEQDLTFAFDPEMGLYRGETSFLDWREQTYPQWTKADVTFLGESFALSTNVLHYIALKQAALMTTGPSQLRWSARARALKTRIEKVFWDPGRKTLRSVVGPTYNPIALAQYDLLGISLAIEQDILSPDRARKALDAYPVAALGSPVVWPQQPEVPIYHNRAIWPFVSAYAMRAARTVSNPARIAFEVNSIIDGAVQNGSNMENYELVTRAAHVDDGDLSGPVVNSPRQLWSVGAMFAALEEGVFGLQMNGAIEPKLPRSLALRVFGNRTVIRLHRGTQVIELVRPLSDGNLWVKQNVERAGSTTRIRLKAIQVPNSPLTKGGERFAPPMPTAPTGQGLSRYVNGQLNAGLTGDACVSYTVKSGGLESLPSRPECGKGQQFVQGARLQPGRYRLVQRYNNPNGPINTGITAAVRRLVVRCTGHKPKTAAIVMPHSVQEQDSTSVVFRVDRAANCQTKWSAGTNMSDLELNRQYTGGKGGPQPLNDAELGPLLISKVAVGDYPHKHSANKASR